jgi:hypothetical protein
VPRTAVGINRFVFQQWNVILIYCECIVLCISWSQRLLCTVTNHGTAVRGSRTLACVLMTCESGVCLLSCTRFPSLESN